MSKVTQKELNEAIAKVCQAESIVSIIAEFMRDGEPDMKYWSFHVGEALTLAAETLSHSYVTIGECGMKVADQP